MTYQVPDWEGVPSQPIYARKPVPPASSSSTDADKEEEAAPAAVVRASTVGDVSRPRPSLKERFDRVLPAHHKYLGRSRRTCLFIVLAVFLLLILVIGLGAGLSKKHSRAVDLPLPSKGGIHTGDLTYYGVGMGACGVAATDSQSICAISHLVYDAVSTNSDPNKNPLCGKKIRVERYDGRVGANRSIDVTVVDRCVGCQANDLDLSPSAFDELADPTLGRVLGSWAWLDSS